MGEHRLGAGRVGLLVDLPCSAVAAGRRQLGHDRLRGPAAQRRRLSGRKPQYGSGDLRQHARRRLVPSGVGARGWHVGGGADSGRRVRLGGRSPRGRLPGADAVLPRRRRHRIRRCQRRVERVLLRKRQRVRRGCRLRRAERPGHPHRTVGLCAARRAHPRASAGSHRHGRGGTQAHGARRQLGRRADVRRLPVGGLQPR